MYFLIGKIVIHIALGIQILNNGALDLALPLHGRANHQDVRHPPLLAQPAVDFMPGARNIAADLAPAVTGAAAGAVKQAFGAPECFRFTGYLPWWV